MDQKRALQVLQAILEVRGFTAVLDGTILKIMSVKRAVASSPVIHLTEPGAASGGNAAFVRAVIPLSNAEAATLAKDLRRSSLRAPASIGSAGANALIITDTESNIGAIREIILALDKGAGNNEWQVFHLKHVPAKKMVDIINELFKQIAPRTPPAPMLQPGQPPPQPGAPGRRQT